MNKNSRIFIAGHRGLIGSAFVRCLQKQGYTKLLTRVREELNLSDRAAVYSFFQETNPEYVIMAAGRVGGIVENKTYPADFMQQNLDIQVNLFSAAVKYNVQRVLFFGSSCMYPRECAQPMCEELLLTGKPESTSLAYAMAKLSGVHMCLAFNEQYQRPDWFVPVIPNSVYGENDNFNLNSGHVLSALINRFHQAKTKGDEQVTLWGSGGPRREFLFSEDLVDACQILLSSEQNKIKTPINIGPGEDISIRELARLVSDVIGYGGEILWDRSKPDGTARKLLDSTQIKQLGWSAKTALQKGIEQTYNWYLYHYQQ